ncbi:LysR family transcriptional regulator [Ottowia sp.]|uniref:LysR family transcriptional regulator n=1 Tax=Ottowia sp. TaxID=1898956 RepID=UPI0039E3A9D8
MNIRFLETFLWLARLKSFRLTAEKLHITQAAISGRIATLEQEFGTRLFDRGTKEISITQQGSKVLPYAERIVRLSQELKREISDRDRVGGLVRLGVIESIVHSLLREVTQRISAAFPNLGVELTSDTTIHLVAQLQRGDLDIMIQTDLISGPGLLSMPLGKYPMRWVASPSLKLGHRSLDVDDLATHPIISFSKNSGPHRALMQLFSDNGVDRTRINCVNSVAAIIQLVRDGYGIAVLPPAVLQQQVATGEIELLSVKSPFPPLQLSLTYRTGEDGLLLERIADLIIQSFDSFALTFGDSVAMRDVTMDSPRDN